MKTIMSFVGLALLCLPSFAQQILRGTIGDFNAKTPLIGANVQVITETDVISTITNEKGFFEVNDVPIGRINVSVSYIGYETRLIEDLLVSSSRPYYLNVELEETSQLLNSVEIIANKNNRALNELSTVSSRSFTMEALERQPANFADPARMALNFPGVAVSGDDILNELVVRGNAPNGILWRLEGIEIPNPNHFASRGSSGGGISMLSANSMSTSDFFSGAFPAEYGNATSGVMDIRMRNGSYLQKETAIQIGLLGLDISTEGPFKKNYNGSYLVNYRYSTLGILDRIGLNPDGGAIPDFQDLSFKFNFPTNKIGTFGVFGLGGKFLEDDLIQGRIAGASRFEDWGRTGIGGINHLIFVSDKTYVKTIFSGSKFSLDYEESFAENVEELEKRYDESFSEDATRLSILVNHKFNSKHLIRIGGIASRLGYKLKMSEETFEITEENGIPKRTYTGEWITFLEDYGTADYFQSYIQWKTTLSSKLIFNFGFHYSYFELNNDDSTEPRIGIKYKLSNKQEFTLGYGHHSRIEPLPTYFVRRENNSRPHLNLPLQKSRHFVLGHRIELGKSWVLSNELYVQKIKNIPVDSNAQSFFTPLNADFFDLFFRDEVTLVGKGEGLNYGLDISLERRFKKQFYAIINSSILSSEFKPSTKHWYSTRFNTGFNLLVTGGKEFSMGQEKNKTVGLNARFILNGGQRYTPIDIEESLLQERTVFSKLAYSGQLPTYYRIDFGIYYRIPKLKTQHLISLNIQNVTNRLNVYRREQRYDEREPDKIRITDSEQTGMIPILNYRIEF